MAAPLQHSPSPSPQRQHGTGTHQVRRGGGRIGQDPGGAGTLDGVDPRGDPVGRVDSNGVASAQWVLARRPHEGQIELVGPFLGHGCTQVAGGVAHHPANPARISEFCGQDGVPLVLSVGIVGNEHRSSGT